MSAVPTAAVPFPFQAQKVAQLAINAREAHVKARARVDQAVADMESAEIVKQKLLKDLQELRGQQEKLQLEDAKVMTWGVV